MAHPNIEERRDFVALLLKEGRRTGIIKVVVSEKFNCSPAAINADIIFLKNKERGLPATYHIGSHMRKRIYARDGKYCQYCGLRSENAVYIIEHIIPASIGGTATTDNLVVACQSCNTTKRNRIWAPKNLYLVCQDVERRNFIITNSEKIFL